MNEMNRCPVCVEQGLRSVFYPAGGAFATAMSTHTFYDEDGNRHFHDPNRRSSGAHCSTGHVIKTWWIPACPSCDFGGGGGWERDQDTERERATPHWVYKLNGEPPELRMPPCPPDIERPSPPQPPALHDPRVATGTWTTPKTWSVSP